MQQLDVLLVESHPGVGGAAAHALERAGHTVHRCHEADSRGFPCAALTEGACPLDGPVDVVYLARGHVVPRPTPLEHGVSCAVRAHVPIVESGPEILDPFARWIDRRIDHADDPVEACEAAATHAFDALAATVADGLQHAAADTGLPADGIECHIARVGTTLDVHLSFAAPVSPAQAHRLGVRVLDWIRADPREFGTVNVRVDGEGDDGAS
jgi:hypothetical protein